MGLTGYIVQLQEQLYYRKDDMIVSIDIVTNFMAGTVIFSYLGNIAQEMNIALAQGTDTMSAQVLGANKVVIS
ncbi:unnamed protein product [Gordionus sp. m RMFG-2023]